MTDSLDRISIRHTLVPGDLGSIIHLHGRYYGLEYGYGVAFESYVAAGLHDFYSGYRSAQDRIWICEYDEKIVGSLVLMHRENTCAQLRYFLVVPEFRGIGLGRKLMESYMDFLIRAGYESSYLWTTHELSAAAALYKRFGFRLTEEKESTAFGKQLREQRYDLNLRKRVPG